MGDHGQQVVDVPQLQLLLVENEGLERQEIGEGRGLLPDLGPPFLHLVKGRHHALDGLLVLDVHGVAALQRPAVRRHLLDGPLETGDDGRDAVVVKELAEVALRVAGGPRGQVGARDLVVGQQASVVLLEDLAHRLGVQLDETKQAAQLAANVLVLLQQVAGRGRHAAVVRGLLPLLRRSGRDGHGRLEDDAVGGHGRVGTVFPLCPVGLRAVHHVVLAPGRVLDGAQGTHAETQVQQLARNVALGLEEENDHLFYFLVQ